MELYLSKNIYAEIDDNEIAEELAFYGPHWFKSCEEKYAFLESMEDEEYHKYIADHLDEFLAIDEVYNYIVGRFEDKIREKWEDNERYEEPYRHLDI